MDIRRTHLYDAHIRHKAKMIEFHGWELPVEYEGIIAEHKRVRTLAGLFDVSHMGEVFVTGERATDMVQKIVTGDAAKLAEGQVMYSLMCYEHGGIVDDLLVYKFSPEKFLLVVNASNADKDFAWIKEHEIDGAVATNVSDEYAQVALQGPKADEVLQKLCNDDLKALKLFRFIPETTVAGRKALVSRTGYTGERGFEIYLSQEDADAVWEAIIEAGAGDVAPIGLGARDTLRFEAKLPLYGQEISASISPLEAGLGFFVKFDKGDFIGRDALLKQQEDGLKRQLVEFEMVGRGIPRAHYPIQKNGEVIGEVTTGSFAPTLEKNIGLALIDSRYTQLGESIDIMIRNKPVEAKVAADIFYVPSYRRKKAK